nr:MAG TPA: hypothetical protein [Bacteriophage sp.]
MSTFYILRKRRCIIKYISFKFFYNNCPFK